MEREIKLLAIVLKSSDDGESGRKLTLLTSEFGKIYAKIRGVKKQNSKLAFASFPFNFGEYLLVKSGTSYVVTNCNFIDDFSKLSSDLNNYYAGCSVLEVASIVATENQECSELLVAALNALKLLSCESGNVVFYALCKFMVDVLKISGLEATISDNFINDKSCYFNFEDGTVSNQMTGSSVLISNEEAELIQQLIETEKRVNVSKNLLKLMVRFFESNTSVKLKIIEQFL